MQQFLNWFIKLYPAWLVGTAMLAKLHFTSQPLAAVPAVFSGVMQNILGGLLASWWHAQSNK